MVVWILNVCTNLPKNDFLPQLANFFSHGYIRYIRDILQLCKQPNVLKEI